MVHPLVGAKFDDEAERRFALHVRHRFERCIAAERGLAIAVDPGQLAPRIGVHVALGDNSTFGGTVAAGIHLDGIMRKPSLFFDGKPVMEKGVWKV